MSVRTNLGGNEHSPARYSAGTRADLNRLPSQSVLHCEDIPDPSFNVPALLFLVGICSAVCAFLVISFYVVSFIFGDT